MESFSIRLNQFALMIKILGKQSLLNLIISKHYNCILFLQVSPTYAQEVSGNSAVAPHLYKFHGILNGIDPDIWDPYNDKFIPVSKLHISKLLFGQTNVDDVWLTFLLVVVYLSLMIYDVWMHKLDRYSTFLCNAGYWLG